MNRTEALHWAIEEAENALYQQARTLHRARRKDRPALEQLAQEALARVVELRKIAEAVRVPQPPVLPYERFPGDPIQEPDWLGRYRSHP